MLGAETHPFAGLFQLGHSHPDREETYQIREKVIARKPMCELEVGADETAVRDDHLEDQLNRGVGDVLRTREHLERGNYVYRADRRFHRVQPVWSEARRIRFLPRGKLKQELCSVAFIARECVSAAQRR